MIEQPRTTSPVAGLLPFQIGVTMAGLPTYPNGMTARIANDDGFDVQCEATDGEGRCSYPVGHAELTWGGDTYSHACLNDRGEFVTAWNPETPDTSHQCGAATVLAAWNIPRDAPETPVNCSAKSPHGDVCTLAAGHPGEHERHFAGERMASWADPAICPANLPGDAHHLALSCARPADHDGTHQDSDGSRWRTATRSGWHLYDGPDFTAAQRADWEKALSDSLSESRHHRPLSPVPFPQLPVRMRLVSLPHSAAFALVVDRFRDAGQHADEHLMWKEIGERLGAVTTICYPGELDVIADTPE